MKSTGKLIEGIDINKCVRLSCGLKHTDKLAVEIVLEIPVNCRSESIESVSLDDNAVYEYSHDVYNPFGVCKLYNNWHSVSFHDDIKYQTRYSDFGSYFNIDVDVVKVTDEFDNVFRKEVFEGAVERDIYNNWGPGKYEFDYESGLDWKYQQINENLWLSFLSRRKASAVRMNDSVNHYETWMLPISKTHILKIHFGVSFYSTKSAQDMILEYMRNVIGKIVCSLQVQFLDEHKSLRDKEIVTFQLEDNKGKLIEWREKPFEFVYEIHDRLFNVDRKKTFITKSEDGKIVEVEHLYELPELDDKNYFDPSLLFNPYDPEQQDRKISLPKPINPEDPVLIEQFRQQKDLAKQMRETLQSHIIPKSTLYVVK